MNTLMTLSVEFIDKLNEEEMLFIQGGSSIVVAAANNGSGVCYGGPNNGSGTCYPAEKVE